MNDKEADNLPAIHISLEKPAERGDPLHIFLVRADADYVAARVLFACGISLQSGAFFHSHQAVEKYLKAFLHSRKCDFAFTHNLKTLCVDAARLDEYFGKPRVRLTCENLSLIFEWTRYPERKLAGFGLAWGDFLDFLDDFAYTVRIKIPFPGNLVDLPGAICEGKEDSFGPSGTFDFEFIARSFFAGNRRFAPKSTQQED